MYRDCKVVAQADTFSVFNSLHVQQHPHPWLLWNRVHLRFQDGLMAANTAENISYR